MNFQILNPLEYPDWDRLVLGAENCSFFHSSAWAGVLVESYGYKPLYFTSLENGRLSAMVPVMEVDSRLTGKRGVSLPFTDECPQIVPDERLFQEMLKAVINYGEKAGWKYIEWRNGKYFAEKSIPSDFYFTHQLDLAKAEKQLFSGLRDSTRRNIKKATKSHVMVEIDRSFGSLKSFYRLNCMTRKRHGLPPQPFSFFTKIFERVISKGAGFVASAKLSGKVIASAVFFHFGRKAVYKYGASDPKCQDLRPNNLVLWEAIKWCSDNGIRSFNFGRTEPKNEGLLQFKRGWGAIEAGLRYYRYDLKEKRFLVARPKLRNSYKVFRFMPTPMLRIAGDLLYRHAG